MRSFRSGLGNPVQRSGDRLGASGALGTIDYFDYDPGGEWLPADGRIVDWTAKLGPILTPTATTGLVAGSTAALPSAVRDGCCGQGKFVLGTQGGFLVSTDLQTFASIALAGETGAVVSVAFASGLFVAVSSTGKVWTSSDAEVWTLATTLSNAFIGGALFVSFVAGLLLIANNNGNANNQTYLTSPDAKTWTPRVLPTDAFFSIQDVASDGIMLVVACGSSGRLFTTKDAINWTRLNIGSHIPSLACVDNGLIYVGGVYQQGQSNVPWLLSDDGNGAIYSSVSPATASTNTVHRVGDEVIELGGGSGAVHINGGRKPVGISGTPISGTTRILIGNGLMLMFGISSRNFARSTKLRVPRIARRPDAPLLKPYIKVA